MASATLTVADRYAAGTTVYAWEGLTPLHGPAPDSAVASGTVVSTGTVTFVGLDAGPHYAASAAAGPFITFTPDEVESEPTNTVSVQTYDAAGDGVTDDAAAITAAADSLWQGGSGPGGVVYFPRTTTSYMIGSAIPAYPRVRYVGEESRGPGSRIKALSGGDFTNVIGGVSGKYMLKYEGGDSWWHGGSLEYLGFNANNVAGLKHAYFQKPGENSTIAFCRFDNAAAEPRTVSDAVTNGTTTVTSANADFTTEDVNAVVTGTNIPADTKIDRVTDEGTVVLNNAASGSGSGGTLVINRPSDAVTFDGGAATGLLRSLNGIQNSGALLRLKGQNGASWQIDSLSGDHNGGGLLRVSAASASANIVSISISTLKAENLLAATSMDPVILIDNSDMVALNVFGGSATTMGGRDIVRIDQPITTRGGPSVHLVGLEGNNPFNTSYTNIIRDSSTGYRVPTTGDNPGATAAGPFYPNVNWRRDTFLAGEGETSKVGSEPWNVPINFAVKPNVETAGTYKPDNYLAGAIGTNVAYNNSNAQNDEFRWWLNPSKGTWRLETQYRKDADRAIVTWDISFDGGTTWTSIGTVNQYAAAGANGYTASSTFTVPHSGRSILRARAATRDPSATGWTMTFCVGALVRTA